VHEIRIRGGARIVPKLGPGVRVDSGWPQAKLTATRTAITIRHWWAGTLTAAPETIVMIAPWQGIVNHGVLFDVEDLDELWIFQTPRHQWLLDQLTQLGWRVQDTIMKWSDKR
jgi:hypothetical protein